MKHFVYSLFLGLLAHYSWGQNTIREFSRIESLFFVETINIKCDSWGKYCFLKLTPTQKAKDRPGWMKKGSIFYGIIIHGESISRAYSDSYSIMKNTNVWLKDPIMEFKIQSDSTILIVYKKGVFPK